VALKTAPYPIPDGFRFLHWADPYRTHQPVLFELANRCTGPIVEFGCGEGSTELLHGVSERRGIPLLTLETDAEWMDRYAPDYESTLHRFELVTDWEEALEAPRWDEQRWGLAFVDQAPWEARAATVRRVRLTTEYVVVHDCDYLPEAGLMGTMIRPLNGPSDRGERHYDDVFSSWKEFFPVEPWPLSTTGPPTLVGSNVHDVSTIDFSYEDYQPSRARRWVHTGAAAVARRLSRST
jgi:hypothetical protein